MGRIKIGGPSSRVSVSLRVFGEDLEPEEITKLLGCSPTKAFRKGDVESKLNERRLRLAKMGKWLLRVESTQELETAVEVLLAKLTPDLDVWNDLVLRYKVEVFCGVFFDEGNNGNGGFGLSPKLMQTLYKRGIGIGFDIYFA